jgi:hypothetical protein
MPLGPLGVTALLAALDWGAWDWATNSNESTIGLIAGLLMAPIAVAFAWSLVRVLIGLVRLGIHRAAAQSQPDGAQLGEPHIDGPFDIAAHDERIAA